MKGRAVHHSSGTFRVDRKKALAKLSEHALARPEHFLLPWVRCAVACGATKLAAVETMGAIDLVFDGAPFAEADLKDPYAPLLVEAGGEAGRQLALGLLTVLRTRPRRVIAESGSGPGRLRLEAKSLERESLRAAPGDTRRSNVLRVEWGPLGWRWPGKALAAARERCALVPPGFGLAPSALEGARDFSAGAVRGRYAPAAPGAERTRVTLCRLGVAVEGVDTWLPTAQVEAWVDDDGFRLNASQSAVVEDERRTAALDAVALAVRKGVVARARELAAAARRRGPDGLEKADPGAKLRTWLRHAAAHAGERDAAMMEAPLFLDAARRPMTPAELLAEGKRLGYLPWSRVAAPGAALPMRVLLVEDGAALEDARALGPGPLRDATGVIEALASAR